GNVVAQYGLQGRNLTGGADLVAADGNASAWVYGTSFRVVLVTNGVDDVVAQGVEFGDTDVIEESFDPTNGTSRPTIYGMGIDRCSGCVNAFNGSPKVPFAAAPTDNRQNAGIVLRITSDCIATNSGEICLDGAGHGSVPRIADLAAMVCPISAEPAIYA